MIDHLLSEVKPVILASASPRRADLLRQIGLEFHIQPSSVDEPPPEELKMDPVQIAEHLALLKAEDVAANHDTALVIGSDTVVWNSDAILGKPANRRDAYSMLSALSGKRHTVTTGVALISKPNQTTLVFHESTRVVFRALSEEEIHDYIDTGEPMDKAGGYGIQGFGALLVDHIEGDYFNVVGFPLTAFYKALKKLIFRLNTQS
ncbi:MAG: septum formation inhibitor Maf [Candidatus Marinimicrobia bacterium]|nr:septum formation inhibitor Maf [Candidatus Neomarinimicrobiota bacterium]